MRMNWRAPFGWKPGCRVFCLLGGAAVLLSLCGTAVAGAKHPAREKALRIYFVDVEGGQATLFVTPGGQSLLIDTGWPGFEGRDAERIVAAARLEGLSKIDFVLLTHYHTDHAGGLTQLAKRIRIGAMIDHGENRESTDAPTEEAWQDYLKLVAKEK